MPPAILSAARVSVCTADATTVVPRGESTAAARTSKTNPAHNRWFMLRNVLTLSLCWCLGASAVFLAISTTTPVSVDYVGSGWSTLPVGGLLITSALFSMVLPRWVAQYGRRKAFLMGSVLGITGSVIQLCAISFVADHSPTWAFIVLVVGAIPQGVVYTISSRLRFAVALFATEEFMTRALSIVIAGGLASAGIGPGLGKVTRTLTSREYEGSYFLLVLVQLCLFCAVYAVDFNEAERYHAEQEMLQLKEPPTAAAAAALVNATKGEQSVVVMVEDDVSTTAYEGTYECCAGETQDMELIAAAGDSAAAAPDSNTASPSQQVTHLRTWKSPPVLRQTISQAVSYAAMGAIMSATPVSMKDEGLSFDQSSDAIIAHVIGMFVCSAFTGDVIRRLGAAPVVCAGFVVMLSGALTFYAGRTVLVYIVAIFIVGLGWNFAFVGASSQFQQLLRTPKEKAHAQKMSELIVLGSNAAGTTLSGPMYGLLGWNAFVAFYIVLVGLALSAAVWEARRK